MKSGQSRKIAIGNGSVSRICRETMWIFFLLLQSLEIILFQTDLRTFCLLLQLNIKDAFQLCRYEWMREALEKFLTVMAEERKIDEIEEEIVETLSMPPVSEVIAECQIMTSNCGVTTTTSPHHSISALSSFHWQISPLKRLPLSWYIAVSILCLF